MVTLTHSHITSGGCGNKRTTITHPTTIFSHGLFVSEEGTGRVYEEGSDETANMETLTNSLSSVMFSWCRVIMIGSERMEVSSNDTLSLVRWTASADMMRLFTLKSGHTDGSLDHVLWGSVQLASVSNCACIHLLNYWSWKTQKCSCS